ncbi:hypothetical protein EUGRSUZ_K01854 [Eucalyptus grandis]|uniref:Uncharacterized protein n=2 Tax=Eucalyptus grandis TaxID=71139 RepID=A0ACC3IUK4_EUCGR|nr:hypothetical protein EUGRSUZ_K01854 [Eucalyptus grandis]
MIQSSASGRRLLPTTTAGHGGDARLPLVLQVRRRPHRRGDLRLHGAGVRGHLVGPHLPHRLLQGPPLLHRQGLQEARVHEGHHRRLLRRRRLRLPPEALQGQEDGPRRVQPQGVLPRPLPLQVQVRRRRRPRPRRRLRPPQLPLRGQARRQAPLHPLRPRHEDEPPRPPGHRRHRLLHGLPLLPLLDQHSHESAEVPWVLAAAGRQRRALPDAGSQDQLIDRLGIRLGISRGTV